MTKSSICILPHKPTQNFQNCSWISLSKSCIWCLSEDATRLFLYISSRTEWCQSWGQAKVKREQQQQVFFLSLAAETTSTLVSNLKLTILSSPVPRSAELLLRTSKKKSLLLKLKYSTADQMNKQTFLWICRVLVWTQSGPAFKMVC